MPDLIVESYWSCATNRSWRRDVPGSGGEVHVVTFDRLLHGRRNDVEFDYSCSCPSYRFLRGTVGGYCKHIRAVMDERCGWSALVDDGQVVDGKCPRCGVPVVGERHAV